MWQHYGHEAAGIQNIFSNFESFAASFTTMNVWYISTQRDGIWDQQNTNSFEEVPMHKHPTSVLSTQRNGVKNFLRYK
jgi:hypothetical protein